MLKYILPFVTCIAGAACQDLSISLSMHPSDHGGKMVVNSTVVFRCTVNVNILGHGTAEWYKLQGANRYQLGRDSFIHHHLTAPRFHLETQSRTPATAVYLLTISDVQVEDSGVYECTAGSPSTRKAARVLAACVDISSEVCDCTLTTRWSSPDCIYAAASDDGFERATVGLAVCLVVTLLYATVATAVVVYDCRHKLRAARLKEADRDASLAQTAAVISSQTASSSAMKRRAASGPVNDRQAVRFSDDSRVTASSYVDRS